MNYILRVEQLEKSDTTEKKEHKKKNNNNKKIKSKTVVATCVHC